MWSLFSKSLSLPTAEQALPGRETAIECGTQHAVFQIPLTGEINAQHQRLVVGMGCFWGAERLFWKASGVIRTAVGYAGGHTPNPTYKEVCSGHTGHTEVVEVMYDPQQTSLNELLMLFWENHDPTQGMRQGNDVGTQYRSVLYWTNPQQQSDIEDSSFRFAKALKEQGYDPITTEMKACPPVYYAEEYHQQYLFKNPNGYCGLKGTGVSCSL